MAALTQTAANVRPSTSAKRPGDPGIAGAAISAGQPIYRASDGLWYLADADVALGVADIQAVAGCSAGIGQHCDPILEDELFTHGLTGVTAGDTIWVFTTAGTYTKTVADLTTGVFTSVAMIAISATQAVLRITRSRVAHV
jgi:hypothetical protein